MTILTTKLMMKTMMTRAIIFVPAKRATCWQRNDDDDNDDDANNFCPRQKGHLLAKECPRPSYRTSSLHHVLPHCAGGCAHFSLTAASSSSTPISFGFFRTLPSVAHFHFFLYPRPLLRWLLMAFQVPAQWQSESFYWICYDTRTPWFGQSQVLKLLSSHYQRDKSGLVWARGAPSELPSLAK